MYVCVYIYIWTHAYIHMHTYIQTYLIIAVTLSNYTHAPDIFRRHTPIKLSQFSRQNLCFALR